MALSFPRTLTSVVNQEVDATEIDRTWRVNKGKNRWDLVSDVTRTLTAEEPIVVKKDPTTDTIDHSFDIDTLRTAS